MGTVEAATPEIPGSEYLAALLAEHGGGSTHADAKR